MDQFLCEVVDRRSSIRRVPLQPGCVECLANWKKENLSKSSPRVNSMAVILRLYYLATFAALFWPLPATSRRAMRLRRCIPHRETTTIRREGEALTRRSTRTFGSRSLIRLCGAGWSTKATYQRPVDVQFHAIKPAAPDSTNHGVLAISMLLACQYYWVLRGVTRTNAGSMSRSVGASTTGETDNRVSYCAYYQEGIHGRNLDVGSRSLYEHRVTRG